MFIGSGVERVSFEKHKTCNISFIQKKKAASKLGCFINTILRGIFLSWMDSQYLNT